MLPGSASSRAATGSPARSHARWVVAAVAFVALASLFFTLRSSQADNPAGKGAAAERTFEFAPGDLVELKSEALGRLIPVSGTLRPMLQATVRSKVAAEVAALHVQEGEAVQPGAAIA